MQRFKGRIVRQRLQCLQTKGILWTGKRQTPAILLMTVSLNVEKSWSPKMSEFMDRGSMEPFPYVLRERRCAIHLDAPRYFTLSCKKSKIKIHDLLKGTRMCGRRWNVHESLGRAWKKSHMTSRCAMESSSLPECLSIHSESQVFAHCSLLLEVHFVERFHSC